MKLSSVQRSKLDKFQYKSTKIRYLDSIGMTRSEIAKEMKIIYQHVRNVLEMKVKNPIEKF